MNKKTKTILFSATAFLLCILLLCARMTGPLIHVLLGVGLILIMVIHLIRQFKRLKYVPIALRTVDIVLIICTLVMLLSGLALHSPEGKITIRIVHKLSSVFFIIGCLIHMIQHRKGKTVQAQK